MGSVLREAPGEESVRVGASSNTCLNAYRKTVEEGDLIHKTKIQDYSGNLMYVVKIVAMEPTFRLIAGSIPP